MLFSKLRIIGLLCTVAVLATAVYVLVQMAGEEHISSLGRLKAPSVMIPLFFLYALHFLAEPVRWTLYTALKNFHAESGRVIFHRIFACFNITALLSYSLPFKLGLPLRMYLLTTFLNLDSVKVIKLMTVDVAFNLFSWVLVSLGLILLLPELVGYLEYSLSPVLIISVTGVGLVLAFILLRMKGRQIREILKLVPPKLSAIICLTLVIDVLFYGVRHLMLAQVLDVDVPALQIFIISIIAVFAGILSALPMGLGAYDASLVAMLGIYGVDIEVALIIALGNRLGMVLTSVVLGVPSALMLLGRQGLPEKS
jgi:uncharacterized membrane protein YbhN (UPF0104 family)